MRRKSITGALDHVGPVQRFGCRFWQGKVGRDGYGRYYAEMQGWQAPRVVWTLLCGPIPDGLWVLHSCDVNYPPGDPSYRLCVEISHLYLGTSQDNQTHMAETGRVASGERSGSWRHPERLPHGDAHHMAKLSLAKAREIRRRYAEGETQKGLAIAYGVTRTAILQVVRNWTWVEPSVQVDA